jgi:xanthine dehydrogenase YagT iron-sulfur-binding subunit
LFSKEETQMENRNIRSNADFSPNESVEAELLLDELGLLGESRRKFLGKIAGTGLSIFVIRELISQNAFAAGTDGLEDTTPLATSLENPVKVALNVNGAAKEITVDSRMTLLDALRENLALTGSKKGCDHGQCGACTVIVDGRRVLSCLTLTAACEGKKITTIEGLAKAEELHPMQAAFVKHDGFQCGYCTPGQICSAVALLNEAQNGEASYVTADVRQIRRSVKLSDEEIRERMSGNICRCGAYPNIVDAIREVHSGQDVAQEWQFAGDEQLFENLDMRSLEISREVAEK